MRTEWQNSQKPVDTTEVYNKAVKKTEAEVHGTWEKRLREAYPAVDPDKKLKGDELLSAVKAAQQQSSSYDPNQVKKTDEYLSLERQMREALEAKEQEYAAKVQEVQTQFQRQQVWGDMSKVIREKFMYEPGPSRKIRPKHSVSLTTLLRNSEVTNGRKPKTVASFRCKTDSASTTSMDTRCSWKTWCLEPETFTSTSKNKKRPDKPGTKMAVKQSPSPSKMMKILSRRYNAESDPKKKEELASAYRL